jgi:hypothetical protein
MHSARLVHTAVIGCQLHDKSCAGTFREVTDARAGRGQDGGEEGKAGVPCGGRSSSPSRDTWQSQAKSSTLRFQQWLLHLAPGLYLGTARQPQRWSQTATADHPRMHCRDQSKDSALPIALLDTPPLPGTPNSVPAWPGCPHPGRVAQDCHLLRNKKSSESDQRHLHTQQRA